MPKPEPRIRYYLFQVEVGSEADNLFGIRISKEFCPKGLLNCDKQIAPSLAVALYNMAVNGDCRNRLNALLSTLLRKEFRQLTENE